MTKAAGYSPYWRSCLGLARWGTGLLISILAWGSPAVAALSRPDITEPGLSNLTPAPDLIAQADGTLRRGDRGEAVEALQRALGRYGLLPASYVDGIYGQSTEQAIRTFQRIREMPVTGVADTQTLEALGVDLSSYGPALVHPDLGNLSRDRLAYGDTGSDVTRLQQSLRRVGLGVGLDGVYGDETRQAVRTFQRVRQLPVTGTADRNTLNALGFQNANGSSETGSGYAAPNYIAVIIGSNDELPYVRRLYSEATLESTRHGEIITIGRFADRSAAENRAQNASQRGYDARVLHAHEL